MPYLIDDDPESACSQPPGIDQTHTRQSRCIVTACVVSAFHAPAQKPHDAHDAHVAEFQLNLQRPFSYGVASCHSSSIAWPLSAAFSCPEDPAQALPLVQCPVGYIQRSLAIDRVGRHEPTGGACSSPDSSYAISVGHRGFEFSPL